MQIEKDLITRVLRLTKKYRVLLILSLVLVLVLSTIDRGRAVLLKPLFDSISHSADTMKVLKDIILVFALLSFAVFVLKYVKEVFTHYLTQKIVLDIRNKLAEKVVSLDLSFFIRSKAGDMVSRMSNDVMGLEQVVTFFFEDMILHTCHCLIAIGLMFYASPYLGGLAVLLLPLYILPVSAVARKLKRKKLKSMIYLGGVVDTFVNIYRGIKVIKAFNKEEEEFSRFREVNQGFFRKVMQAVRKRAMSLSIVELFISIGLLALFFVIGLLVSKNAITAGSMAVFAYAIAMFNTAARGLTKGYNRLQEGLPAFQRILEVLTLVGEKDDGGQVISGIKSIEFRNVTFSYDDIPVLKDVSFHVGSGEIVALAGKSGVGKTTIIDLICKYYRVDSGSIHVNGIDINEISAKSLRNCIGYCPQDPLLFAGTIRENILYGNPDIPRSLMAQLCEFTGVSDFASTDEELARQVGEGGQALSGGQRQRIAICRALTKPISLLIMDEPTSQLDAATEDKIRKVLVRFVEEDRENRMVLIVSHRLSTMKDTDRIIVLKEGSVAYDGPPMSMKVKKLMGHAA